MTNEQRTLERLKAETLDELKNNILPFWLKLFDRENDGFYGQVDGTNTLITGADKGGVLNARILWTFSAAFGLTGDSSYLVAALRANNYLLKHFVDREFGGVYWKLNSKGEPLDRKKQIYNLAFAIYGLSEFYRISKNDNSLTTAIHLFETIERYSYDPHRGGYLESFSREWGELTDMRLSEKDENEKKTMNTHLHILEAYTNLYKVWKSPVLKIQLERLITLFSTTFINPENYHLLLFFDENWNSKSDVVSFGHDIETAWLLYNAANATGNPTLTASTRGMLLKITEASLEGYNEDGSMNYEYSATQSKTDTERHWWVQAETVVGLLYAYSESNDNRFLYKAEKTWNYIKEHIIDRRQGEWFWSCFENGAINTLQDKAGFWKCPYHNSRMCIEIDRFRI